MKKALTLLLLVFSSVSLFSAKEKRLLPAEIKGENFLLQYKYDNQNRIIERIFHDGEAPIKDVIKYNPSEWKYEEQWFNKEGVESNHTYIYGKKREEGQWLKDLSRSDDTQDYFFDSLGYINIVYGREWDGSWRGGPNLTAYKYKDGNLVRFYLDSEYQQEEFIQAMTPWEQQIFDEEIEYDNQNGIFSQVNKESWCMLTSPLNDFYSMLHLKNNATQIRKPSEDEKVFRNFEKYPAVDVDFKYKFNKLGYPEKVEISINGSLKKQYTIKYQEAHPPIQVEKKAEKLPSSKKLLPKKFSYLNNSISFTYDNQNRFTSIKEINAGDITRYDSIVYYPNREGYKSFCLKDPEGDCYGDSYYSDQDAGYTRKDNMIIMGDEDGDRAEITFTPSRMVSMMKTIDADYNPETSIDPPVIIGFIYDKNDNLIDMYLPNNASGDRVNRNLQMIEYMRMHYDNKNGIFKHVNRDCFMILYNQGEILNYYYYMGNNLLFAQDEYDLDSTYMETEYEYNEDDYPIKMNHFSIEYIDAN